MKRKKLIFTVLLAVAVLIGLFFYIQTPKLESGKITQLTISSLPSPPQQKTITKQEDIQKFVNYFNNLRLYPRLSINVPTGASVWVKTSGELYTHQITIIGNIVQFDHRTYQTNQDVAAELRIIYQSFNYPEMKKSD